ncbi:MarR family transcriptional regulator [Frondihabitans sp. PhB188]|uniref:MarR family winged helix-turn-helix transcriptional regulator n=1 Tax=Frondihabitans sp. PhB188 TaxID=2485200 RepID=UPI000F4660C0|nr:MarR family winged helix-turn-helix transcriptional regulator [Frondihabitans sp. PhB188]ROQ39440.1 MarR family transcriptional regulator [Frondihabitans sp. PhB188]
MSDKSAAVGAWEALFRAQVTIMRELTACFPTNEISFNEYDVLFNLSNQTDKRARIKDLTQHLLLTQPSISRLVDRLTAKGIVEKLSDPGDGRGIIVALTSLGSEVFRSTAVRHADAIARRVGGTLDRDELEQLMALCLKLRLGPKIADTPNEDRLCFPDDPSLPGDAASVPDEPVAAAESSEGVTAPVGVGS